MTTYHFDYTTGNPDNLVGGHPAAMVDLQGSFYDLRAFLNSGVFDALAALAPPVSVAAAAPVLDVGLAGQVRAGRQLGLADFTALGLAAPVGLWNLGDLTNLGAGGALVNKGAVPFGVGINGGAATAAVFAGSTGQALYIADTGAADPFRIRTGSWGCWTRTAKRGTAQALISKWGATYPTTNMFVLQTTTGNVAQVNAVDIAAGVALTGVSDICDDRWHHVVVTTDGTTMRLYVDGVPEAVVNAGPLQSVAAPLNIGAQSADGAAAAGSPHYGRVDEAFVTSDVLTDDQVRLLYCAKLAHTLGAVPARANLNVRRRRKGSALVVADFPTQPLRLHNFTAGGLNDEGSGGVALTNSAPTLIVPVAGADGTLGNAFSFGGAHTGLSSTDAGLPGGLTTRSYGCWFKTTYPGIGGLVSWGTSTTADARLGTSNPTGIIFSASGGDLIQGPVVADGQWHHAVVVEDNTAGDGVRRKLYLDGRLVVGSTVLNSLTLAGANRFRIGTYPDGTNPQVGQIDGAFVTGVALTAEQVIALWAKGTQSLGPSPKEVGAHVEGFDSAWVYVIHDTLDSQHQIDLSVGT